MHNVALRRKVQITRYLHYHDSLIQGVNPGLTFMSWQYTDGLVNFQITNHCKKVTLNQTGFYQYIKGNFNNMTQLNINIEKWAARKNVFRIKMLRSLLADILLYGKD